MSFGGRTANGHEMVLELVSGADFRCVLHLLLSLTCLKRSWGQVWPETGPKPKLKYRFQFPSLCLSQLMHPDADPNPLARHRRNHRGRGRCLEGGREAWPPMQPNGFLGFFGEGGGIGPEIVDFGPLPGPTRSQGGLGNAPAGAPLKLHRFSAR